MESNGKNFILRIPGIFKNFILNLFAALPSAFEWCVHKLDTFLGGTGTVSFFNGRSIFAFFLPIPVYIFIVLGPSLASNVLRGGNKAMLFLVAVIVVQTVYFLQPRKGGMAWLHFGSVVALALLTWFNACKESIQASEDLYRHYYCPLAIIAVFVAVPLAGFFRKCRPFILPADTIGKFQNAFDAKRVVGLSNNEEYDFWDFLRALGIAILRTPLHVITPVAIVVLASSPERLWLWTPIAAFFSLMLFSISVLNPNRVAFVRFVRRAFLSGGALIVTLCIIIIAILRLWGVDYFTTVLDAGSKPIIFSYLFSTYFLFWFYDFWVDQAVLDLLGDMKAFNNESGSLYRQGGGRIAVKVAGNGSKQAMFEPAAFLMRVARTAAVKPENQSDLVKKALRAEQRFSFFRYIFLFVLILIYFVIGTYLHGLDQSPAGLKAKKNTGGVKFDLSGQLLSSGKKPVIMLAASGGGTRAALYTTSVLQGLSRLDKLENLILASGVSGGSAALAYFAIHRPDRPVSPQKEDIGWHRMRETLSAPFIQDVLAGAAEWRIASEYRMGQLLTESFKRRFLHKETLEESLKRITLGDINDYGLILNTSICGASSDNEGVDDVETKKAGGRLVITNLLSDFDMNPKSSEYGWELDLPFEIINDPTVTLFDAASLSANFPPVFSNAAVKLDDKLFLVTDGGAVENRGLVSLLLAVADALESIEKNITDSEKRKHLTDIRIIVADASAFHQEYKDDRGLGAKSSASRQLSNRLIKELLNKIGKLHESISGNKNGIKILYLPMPKAMRASGTFGTHWMMPEKVTFKGRVPGSDEKLEVILDKEDIVGIMDTLFSEDYYEYIRSKWPKSEAENIIKLTKIEMSKTPWTTLETGVR